MAFKSHTVRAALTTFRQALADTQRNRRPSSSEFTSARDAIVQADLDRQRVRGAQKDDPNLSELQSRAGRLVSDRYKEGMVTSARTAATLAAALLREFNAEKAAALRPRSVEPTVSRAEELALHHSDQQLWLAMRQSTLEAKRMRLALEFTRLSPADLIDELAAAAAAGDDVKVEYLDAHADRAIERMPRPRGQGADKAQEHLRMKAHLTERLAAIRSARVDEHDRTAIAALDTEIADALKAWRTEEQVVQAVQRRGYVVPADESTAVGA